jgi:hypothetical protein
MLTLFDDMFLSSLMITSSTLCRFSSQFFVTLAILVCMKRLLPSLALISLPLAAFALDFSDTTSRYSDAPFSQRDTAGISVLTDLGAVSGNPDGTFAPQRTLNRAEFLKIALLSADVQLTDATGCFPDTPASAWFTKYICTAKNEGIVEGNPDGLFHPERDVNYAEALKMLVELFDLPIPEPASNERWAWYTGYVKAADNAGVSLPDGIDAGTFLTRGQMARLAAAFVAESEGELEEYRAFESGQSMTSSSRSSSHSSSMSSVSSIASVSSQSSTSSTSSSSSKSSIKLFPAVSRFAVAGSYTAALTESVINTPSEDVRVRTVEIELRDEVESLESLVLVDDTGRELATLAPRFYSNDDNVYWRVDLDDAAAVLAKSSAIRVGVRAHMKTSTGGALSNEIMEVRSVQIATTGIDTNTLYYFSAEGNQILTHQTSFGRLTMIHNDLGSQSQQSAGDNRLLGRFAVTGESAGSAQVRLQTLYFLLQSTDVNVSNIRIYPAGNLNEDSGCAVETQPSGRLVICVIPTSQQVMSPTPVVFEVVATLAIAGAKQSGTAQLVTPGPGSVTSVGAASWSDGTETFSWIENDKTVEGGPLVTVTK